MIARNERAQLDSQIVMRLSEARNNQAALPLHSDQWWYWHGKVEAYKTIRNLVFDVWHKARGGGNDG